MDRMYLKKAAFIIFQLESLVKKINDKIINLNVVSNEEDDDVVAVLVCYSDLSIIKVNVECDSLAAIAIDVIRAIQ